MIESSSCPLEEDPNAIAQRLLQKAHNRDGLPEITTGVLMLIISGLIGAQIIFTPGSLGYKAATWALVIGMPLSGFSVPLILKWIRRQFLIERVGYVKPKPIRRKPIVFVLAIGIAALLAMFLVVNRDLHLDQWLLGASGLFCGAIWAFGGRSTRFVVSGLLTAAAGIAVAFSGVTLDVGFTLLWGFVGLLSLLSGCVVFLRFIRQPAETEA
jgi:hypothetical protein